MPAEIKVPSLGESVTEATVAKWLKRPGEPVAIDEPIAELETDKITLEVYAPAAGTLPETRAEEGANVRGGAVLGRMADGGEPAAPPPPAAAGPPLPPPPPPLPPPASGGGLGRGRGEGLSAPSPR